MFWQERNPRIKKVLEVIGFKESKNVKSELSNVTSSLTKFQNSLLPEHNRVHQVYVLCESTPVIRYRRRKLGHKIAGFETSEDLPSLCLQQRVLYLKL